MPMNPVQFQRGMPLVEFIGRFGTEEACEAELEEQRWPEGWRCPACAGREHSNFRRGRLLYFQCCGCRHQCSLLSGTVFESTKLELRVWFIAAHLLSQAKNNVSALELKRHLGVCYKTAWTIKHKLMEAMRVRESDRTLRGTVQIDEAFLGGEASSDLGQGWKKKVPLLAAVSVQGYKPIHVCLSQQPATGEDVVVFAINSLASDCHVVSDGAPSFNYVIWCGATHQAIVTGGGKAGCEIPALRAINIVLGNLKTGLAGTYHAFKFAKYADRYLAEFQYRFNRRFRLDLLMQAIIRAAANCKPTPMRSLRMAEDCR